MPLDSCVHAVLISYHSLVGWAPRDCCRGVHSKCAFSIRFTLGGHDSVPDKRNSQFGIELQTNRFCIKNEIYWPTSDRNRTGNYGRCKSFDWAICTAFCTETRGCPTVIWSKCSEGFCIEISGCTPTKLWLHKNWVKEIVKLVQLCVENSFRRFPVELSDEAHFHFSGTVNKQNFRYWSHNKPRELHQRPLHSPKVTVWCAFF
jgi:hypothetical protein